MKYTKTEFAGVKFSGYAHGENHITVSVPTFRKILASGKVKITSNYYIERDGNGAYDTGRTDGIPAEAILKYLSDYRPWLLYLEPSARILHYCPHSNSSYSIREA